MSSPKHLWNGSEPKAVHRIKKLFELENMMFRKQQAKNGLQEVHPMRLLREDIAIRRSAKERERGWINSYKGDPQPRTPFGYMDNQFVLNDKIMGHEQDSPQTFLASSHKSKEKNDVKMQGREQEWTTYGMNETLYRLSKPWSDGYNSYLNHIPDVKVRQRRNVENARRLEAGWVSFGREQGKGRPRGITTSELQARQKARTERAAITGGATERSAINNSEKNFMSTLSDDWPRREDYNLVVPIGTPERTGFGSASDRASNLALENRQSLESGCRETDDDILKKRIEKEDQTGWMSSYKRKQMREMYGLAKLKDKTADVVLKESYDKYREGGWINSLQRQKPTGVGSKRGQTIGEMM